MGPIPLIWRAFRGLDRRRTRGPINTRRTGECPAYHRSETLVPSKREVAVQDISLINLPVRAFSTVDSNWGPKSTPISLARFLAHSPTLRESR